MFENPGGHGLPAANAHDDDHFVFRYFLYQSVLIAVLVNN